LALIKVVVAVVVITIVVGTRKGPTTSPLTEVEGAGGSVPPRL